MFLSAQNTPMKLSNQITAYYVIKLFLHCICKFADGS